MLSNTKVFYNFFFITITFSQHTGVRTGVAAGRGRHHIRSLLRRQAGSFVGGAGQLQVERVQESRMPHQGFRRTSVRVCFCLFAD